MAKVEPADDDLGNGTSRHDYNENNGAKLFDCQGDENLTQGRSTRFFKAQIEANVRLTCRRAGKNLTIFPSIRIPFDF